MRIPSTTALFVASSFALLTACGGSQPPPEEPAAESTPESDAPADEEESAEGNEKGEADAEASAEPSEPTVTRTPKDMLTAPDVTFMFSFNDSEPKEKAEEKCEAQSKGDPKKNAQCMTKARSKFQADGMQFKKNDQGQWTWFTLRRKGSTITWLHKIPIDFGEETKTSIVIKPTGRDTGRQPMRNIPSQVTIEVPNEFQIAIKDPEHGRLVYEAKIGITSDGDGGKASGDSSR